MLYFKFGRYSLIPRPVGLICGAILLSAVTVSAQTDWTSSGGTTTTPDSVNIGSSAAPQAKLDVTASGAWLDGWANGLRTTGANASLRLFDTTTGKAALMGYGSGTLWFGLAFGTTGGYVLALHDAGGMDVYGGNGPAINVHAASGPAALFNGGSVGIGTTTPYYPLDVEFTSNLTSGTKYGSVINLTASPQSAGTANVISAYIGAGESPTGSANTSLQGLWGQASHTNGYTLPQARAVHAAVESSGPANTVITDSANFYADSPITGGSAGIVTQYGLYISTQKVNAVQYGYGIYQASASDSNYFAGNTTFAGTVTGGNIVAKYQDVAEWVPANGELAPGTVVVVKPDADNEVTASLHSYDTSVAGVVSEQPGITLGEPSQGKAKVATTGRVKVKVDATRAPIRAGDVLVTSDTPGTAMKSEPIDIAGIKIHRPGTIIGKALEPLAKGRGEILVLLSLQ